MKKKSLLAAAALTAVGALALAGCSNPNSNSGSGSGSSSSSPIVVGSANFPESQLLGTIYQQALQAKGIKVTTKFNIGSREIYLKALGDGSIDLLPEYNGALLADLDAKSTATSPTAVYKALQSVMPKGIITLPQSDAQDKDTLSVTKATADKYNLKTIADLKPVADQLTIAAGPEFAERQQGILGLKSLYGITFKTFSPLDAGGPLTLAAVTGGQAQVGDIFSTDPAIKTDNLVSLTDTKDLFTSQNILPIVRKSKASSTVKSALNGVSKVLTTTDLTEYNKEITVDKKSYSTVAAEFIKKYNLGK